MTDKSFKATGESSIVKVDESHGVVFGWAIICKDDDGNDYYDVQGDHIPEEAMLGASVDFMKNSRIAGDMHEEPEGGTIVFAWPMTSEIAKMFGFTTKRTGLMIGMKPEKPETIEKFKDGTYNGFSIGGQRIKDEVVNG